VGGSRGEPAPPELFARSCVRITPGAFAVGGPGGSLFPHAVRVVAGLDPVGASNRAGARNAVGESRWPAAIVAAVGSIGALGASSISCIHRGSGEGAALATGGVVACMSGGVMVLASNLALLVVLLVNVLQPGGCRAGAKHRIGLGSGSCSRRSAQSGFLGRGTGFGTVKGMWLRVRSFQTDVRGIAGPDKGSLLDASALLTHLSLSLSLCCGRKAASPRRF
jgi:hypothetical protein